MNYYKIDLEYEYVILAAPSPLEAARIVHKQLKAVKYRKLPQIYSVTPMTNPGVFMGNFIGSIHWDFEAVVTLQALFRGPTVIVEM